MALIVVVKIGERLSVCVWCALVCVRVCGATQLHCLYELSERVRKKIEVLGFVKYATNPLLYIYICVIRKSEGLSHI